MEVQLQDGQRLIGEALHRFDQRLWWDAQDTFTLLLYDPGRFAPYPDDRSISLIAGAQITSERAVPRPADWTRYPEHLEQHALLIDGSPLMGPAFIITAHERYHLEENGYGDFAWDLVKTDENGARLTGTGTENSDFLVWDQPVFLPSAGTVVEVERDGTDNIPGAYPEGAVNNLIGVHLGGQYYLYLLHFAQGSIPPEVEVGAQLERGAFLGRVGNSGVSLEPHLHLTVLWFDEASARTWSVPGLFRALYLSEAPQGAAEVSLIAPPSGVWISDSPF